MVSIRNITISPALINTSCAWASDEAQLAALFDCPYTGAVTTRTATLGGFDEDASHTVTPSLRFTNGPANPSHLGRFPQRHPLLPQFLRLLPPPPLQLRRSRRMGPLHPQTHPRFHQTVHHQHHRIARD